MSKQFAKGNKYVFVAKKCKRGLRRDGEQWSEHKRWINKINGLEVDVIDKLNGTCRRDAFEVAPTWCKCIGVDTNA